MHSYVLHNESVQRADEKTLATGQVGLLTGWGVFSTLRVADGVLFAYERHWKRMQNDAQRLRIPFPSDPERIKERLLALVEANHAYNSTLRVNIVRNRGGAFEGPDLHRDFDVIAFTRELVDWGDSVRLGLKPYARYAQNEFAGTKILSWAQNLAWYEEAHERALDEYVLLNERGEVSECTSANIFALRGAEVLTPPLSSGCLPGITREILLEEIRVPGIALREQTILPSDLESADQVFITSSTRDLLPVVHIESLRLRCAGDATEKLAEAFRIYRQKYVQQETREVSNI